MVILIVAVLTWFSTLLGINLYAFRYTGDERVFAGVNAAEIQADPRHAHAVHELGVSLSVWIIRPSTLS